MALLESLVSLRQFRYFICVVEQRSFTSAAAILHVAQPSLSRQVAQLEEIVGEQLLIRTPTGIIPTEPGFKVYYLARSLLEQVNGLVDEVRGTEREPQGRVSIALPATGGTDLIAEVIKACKSEIPQVSLHVQDGISTLTGQMLGSGLVDFGVVPNAEDIHGIASEPLFIEHLFIVRSKDGRQRQPSEIDFASVTKLPLVMGPRSMHLRRYLEKAAADNGIELQIAYEQQTVGTIAGFVKAGLAATITNWPSLTEHFPVGTVWAQRIIDPELNRVISIAHPAERPLGQAARAAYNIVRRLLLERVKDGRWRGKLC